MQLIGMGLADDKEFVHNLLSSVISQKDSEEIELLTLQQFLKIFEYDKFGERACELLKHEMQEKQHKANILKAAANAKLILARAFSGKKISSSSLNEIFANKPSRITLAQKLAAIQDWFELAKPNPHDSEVETERLALVLVDKRLVADVD